jgi:hypothetical protein
MMASSRHSEPKTNPVAMVVLRLPRRIEEDYIRRAVFQQLRYENAKSLQANVILHLVSSIEAASILNDATERLAHT